MKNVLKMFGLICCLMMLAACGGGGDSSPTPTPTPTPATGSLTVQNNSAKTITGVYISPTSQNTWGSNKISSSILPGNSRTIVGIPVNSYDVKYTFSDTTSLVSTITLNMTAGGSFTRTISKSAAKSADDEVSASGAAAAADTENFSVSGEPGDAK